MTKRIALLFIVSPLAAILSWAGDFSDYSSLGSAQIAAMFPTETRTIIDLSGTWQRMADGVPQEQVFIPGPVDSRSPVILRRTMKIDQATLLKNTWHLQVLGVVDEVELRVNGRFVMRYPGGMVPFTIRIPDRVLTAGTNTVELVVSPMSELTALVESFARSSRARRMGLLREVFLVGTPHVWTNDVRVRSSVAGSTGRVHVTATVMGGTVERLFGGSNGGDALAQGKVNVAVETLILTRNGNVIVARSGPNTTTIERSRQQNIEFDLAVASPDLWSVASPTLYDLVVRIEKDGQLVDAFTTPIGFRNVNITSTDRGRRLSVNDSIVAIHAVDYVEDYPHRGASMSWRQMEQDVSLMKTLGVNVVRTHNGSPHPYFLALCDRYGIMVMAEIPAADIPSDMIRLEEILARYRNASERTIAYLDSHPSVIALGLSDGLEEGSEDVAAYHADLVKLYRRVSSKMLYKVISAGLVGSTSEGGFDLVVVSFSSTQDRQRFD